MFLPRILSKNTFDIRGLGVEVCPHEWTVPSAYEILVQETWKDLLARSRHPIWDGTYYRLLNPAGLEWGEDAITLRLGTIRYRYIATYPMLHQHHAIHQLGPLHHVSTIALICTGDGYYLFGRRMRNGEIDLIGGGVQRDELAIANGADLERNLLKEIQEETGISGTEIRQLTGIGILLSENSNVLIVGHAKAGLTRAEATARFALRTEDEMFELVFIPENGLRSALREMSDYRRLIPELMQPG